VLAAVGGDLLSLLVTDGEAELVVLSRGETGGLQVEGVSGPGDLQACGRCVRVATVSAGAVTWGCGPVVPGVGCRLRVGGEGAGGRADTVGGGEGRREDGGESSDLDAGVHDGPFLGGVAAFLG